MAESNITKRALAAALKDLMQEIPFGKITIANICDRCGMSRKSFYYHFKDKYDLINWIFENEYVSIAKDKFNLSDSILSSDNILGDERWAVTEDLCRYFYNNRSFYSKVFQIKGQNCFTDYFRDLLRPLLLTHFNDCSPDEQVVKFFINFYMDSSLSALERWIIEKNTIPPEQFIRLLQSCLRIQPDLTDLSENK